MSNKSPRTLVVARIKNPNNGKYLADIFEDSVKGEKFYRMPGGGVDFGELAKDALHREFMEELGIKIIVGDIVAVKENIFTYEGSPGHEIVFMYDAELEDKSLYDLDGIPYVEKQFVGKSASWVELSDPTNQYGIIK